MEQKQQKEVQFRLERLRSSMRALEYRLLGTDRTVLPFLTDGRGAFSQERAQALLDGLTAHLSPWYADRARMTEFYQCVFYCALRARTTLFTRYWPGSSATAGKDAAEVTFETLLDLLRPGWADGGPVYYPVAPVDPWLSEVTQALYRALTGKDLDCRALYGPEQPWESDDEIGDAFEEYWNSLTPEEQAELEKDVEGGSSEADRAALEEQFRQVEEEYEKDLAQETRRLRKEFPCQAEYVHACERMVELFPICYERYRFQYDMLDMVGGFLLEAGASRLNGTEPCLTVRAYLDKALRAAARRQA